MNKTARIIQIIFSIICIPISVILIGFAGMATNSAMNSGYTLQAVGAFLLFSCFVSAPIIFLVSIFKPKALLCLFFLPVLIGISSILEKSTYDITPEYQDLSNHKKIGSELVVLRKAYLVSNLPKKRMRNYSFLCKHDFGMTEKEDYISSAPQYAEPKFEEVIPPVTFKVVGVFRCDKSLYFSLEDSTGRLIELDEFWAKILSKKET